MFDEKKFHNDVVIPEFKKKFSLKNVMEVPRLESIVVSMGAAEAFKDKNAVQDCVNELAAITGQKPVITRAKKSISNFKLKEGAPVGLKVTLRRSMMYSFFFKLINVVFPRIRDFRGFPKAFDGKGNYNIGLRDQQIFPEIDLDKVKRTQGMNIAFVTNANNDEMASFLFSLFKFPFKVRN